MIGKNPVATDQRRNRSVFAVTVIAFVGFMVLWWRSQSPVVLSEDGYDVAIALYRVCNQQSEEGLLRIEQHLRQQAISASSAEDASHQALSSIVADARAGDWNSATRLCRALLEDQVRR